MKPFKYLKGSPEDRKKVYRYSNYLQSKDDKWVDRNSLPEDAHDELDDELQEPIEEDIRD